MLKLCFLLIFLTLHATANSDFVTHRLDVQLNPNNAALKVEDVITLPPGIEYDQFVTFKLHANLKIIKVSRDISIKIIDSSFSLLDNIHIPTRTYQIKLKSPKTQHFTIQYEGQIDHPISDLQLPQNREELQYNHGIALINPEAVFLSKKSHWFPIFQHELMQYSLDVTLPKGWQSISQGRKVDSIEPHDSDSIKERWVIKQPMNELTLIAGKFERYSLSLPTMNINIYLREKNPLLAAKYQALSQDYLTMYNQLIGPYPFSDFSIVQTAWPTNMSLPGISLFGQDLLQHPKTAHYLFPHNLLHNWWGNSVFSNHLYSDWPEGLTSYLSTHLLAEQRLQAHKVRVKATKQYNQYVNDHNDFPVSIFQTRSDHIALAIGIDKSLMVWHMLRQYLGDQLFISALKHFYTNSQFTHTNLDDLRLSFEHVSGKKLDTFFQQWFNHIGAPELNLKKVFTQVAQNGYEINIELEQKHIDKVFSLNIPLLIVTKTEQKLIWLELTEKRQAFLVDIDSEPESIWLDPFSDILHRKTSTSRLVWHQQPKTQQTADNYYLQQNRKSLSTLPQDFSIKRLKSHIKLMHSGRLISQQHGGNSQGDLVTEYIIREFEKVHLKPLPELNYYIQPLNKTKTLLPSKNIFAYLQAKSSTPQTKTIILSTLFNFDLTTSSEQSFHLDSTNISVLLELIRLFHEKLGHHLLIAVFDQQHQEVTNTFLQTLPKQFLKQQLAHIQLSTRPLQQSFHLSGFHTPINSFWNERINRIQIENNISFNQQLEPLLPPLYQTTLGDIPYLQLAIQQSSQDNLQTQAFNQAIIFLKQLIHLIDQPI